MLPGTIFINNDPTTKPQPVKVEYLTVKARYSVDADDKVKELIIRQNGSALDLGDYLTRIGNNGWLPTAFSFPVYSDRVLDEKTLKLSDETIIGHDLIFYRIIPPNAPSR